MKGNWRTYDYPHTNQNEKKLGQYVYVKTLSILNDLPVHPQNQFTFTGVIVKKLFEVERNAEGRPIKENGRLVPKLDENKNVRYTVRKNKEGHKINDFVVAIARHNGIDHIPCVAYGKLGTYIAKEIDLKTEVKGQGYMRTRFYEQNGETHRAYEAVITQIAPKKEETETEREEE